MKKNSEGKNVFWFGFKGHFAVETQSQYILQSILTSGNLNDGRAAIPLLKGIHERFPELLIKHAIMDSGYDYAAIYKQVYRMGAQSVIAYNKEERIGTRRVRQALCSNLCA